MSSSLADGRPASRGKDTRFVIIGAGICGVLMAIKLLERGFRNFVILEKAQAMGGTWRDNVYPGVACDVAAHLYSYSFAGNPWWQSRYAKGPDICRLGRAAFFAKAQSHDDLHTSSRQAAQAFGRRLRATIEMRVHLTEIAHPGQ